MSSTPASVLVLLFFVMGILSCQSNDSSASQDSEKEESSATTASDESATPAYPFEVATSFDQLAPIFESTSDSTYVINFWATWCKPCVEELPYFEKLHDDFAGEKVRIILVSLDFAKDIEKKLVPFVKEHQLRSEVIALLDGQYHNWIDRVDTDWGGAIPVTIVYKGEKRQFYGEQFSSYEELTDLVKQHL